MTKARLTGGQVVAAVFAGVFGHLLFAAGWITLGFVLFGGLIVSILGGTVASLFGLGTDGTGDFVDSAGQVLGGVFTGFLIGALVVMLLGFLVSGWILSAGRVRKPWGTSLTSVIIAAVLGVPLLLAYVAISGENLPLPLVAVLGTVIVGVLVWLWMTWAHRGPATDAAITATPAAPAVEAPPADKA